MSKWQNKHKNIYYAINKLQYGITLKFILAERKEGQRQYERIKEKIR